MVNRHLKRLNAPKTWKIQRRGITFITRPNPGGAPKEMTISISNFLKYDLGMANSIKEVKHIIKEEEVLVNGKKVTSYKYPVCFTDVVSIPKIKQYYRMIIDTDNVLKPVAISKDEADFKVLKIVGKSFVKGKLQFNLMDGRNIFFEKPHYKVGDSLLIGLSDSLVKEHIAFEKGMLALLYKGTHVGKIGTIEDVNKKSVVLKTGNDRFETNKNYLLVVGKEKPVLKITK